MYNLEEQLNFVLEKLAPMFSEAAAPVQNAETISAEKIQSLFERLEPMLASHNPECMNLLDDIRLVPGAEELAQQIEDFEFRQAALALGKLKAGGIQKNG
jgi:hypothetical protein